jgi:hypothetical protein
MSCCWCVWEEEGRGGLFEVAAKVGDEVMAEAVGAVNLAGFVVVATGDIIVSLGQVCGERVLI